MICSTTFGSAYGKISEHEDDESARAAKEPLVWAWSTIAVNFDIVNPQNLYNFVPN